MIAVSPSHLAVALVAALVLAGAMAHRRFARLRADAKRQLATAEAAAVAADGRAAARDRDITTALGQVAQRLSGLDEESVVAREAAAEAVRLAGARHAEVRLASGVTERAGWTPATCETLALPLEFGGERLGEMRLAYDVGTELATDRPRERIIALETAAALVHARALRELRLERERFRALHEHAPIGILVCVEGSVLLANPAVEALVGPVYLPAPQEEVIGQIFPPDEAERVADAVAGRSPHVRILRIESHVRGRDGDLLPVEVLCCFLEVDGRKVTQTFLRDRRDEIRAQHEIAERNSQLMRQERFAALGNLSAGVAHEINNPLAFVTANEDLLRDSIEAALAHDVPGDVRAVLQEGRESLAANAKGLQRIRHVVASLRQFAKPSEQRQEVDIAEIARGAVLLSKTKFTEGRAAEIATPDEPLHVVANADELGQVLLNLIVNAAEASPAGGRVKVLVRAAGTRAEVHVEDEGPGVPAGHAERLFNPFFTTKAHGTGLGLSISHEIVKNHGGALTFENLAPKGARFTVSLPLHTPTD